MAEDKKSAVDIAWGSVSSQFQITHQAAPAKEFKREALKIL
jgi:hypothetical protein